MNKKDLKQAMKNHISDFEKNKEEIQRRREELARSNKNCISFWFPKIKDIPDILTPKTYIVPFHYNDLLNAMDRKISESYKISLEKVKESAREIGYPCFIKNAHFSGKHSWANSCYVESEDVLEDHILNITSDAYCLGLSDSLYFVVRELIKTKPAFFAFGGTPITKERRFFVKDGKVTFFHAYWPPFSINNPDCENWEEKLAELNYISREEELLLTQLSEKVSQNIEGAWSVDWLESEDGRWYLIDMALEENSFKWQDDKK